jgi:hypothetical protein
MAEKHSLRWCHTLLSSVLALSLLEPQLVRAQGISEYQVKAAYLYNFAKFVDWPDDSFASPTAPIRLCVLNDRSFQTQLEQIVIGKNIIGHPVLAIPVETGEESRDCQVLFISSSRQPRHIFDSLQGASVLTVGETTGFLDEGGMINFIIEGNQVHFQVNQKAATKARLRMSSRLLSLAKVVIK